MAHPEPSGTASAVSELVGSSTSEFAERLTHIKKTDIDSVVKKAKRREKKATVTAPYQITNDVITTAAGEEIIHTGGGKTFEFTPKHGFILAKVRGQNVWYFAKAGSIRRLGLNDALMHNGALKSKVGNVVLVPDTEGPSLDEDDVYRYRGSAITWTRRKDEVYNFQFDGTEILAVSAPGTSESVVTAQSKNMPSLGFGDLYIKSNKAVTLNNEEIFPEGMVEIRRGEKMLTETPKEEKRPAAKVDRDPTTGALTYQGKRLSVNGRELYFHQADARVTADGGYEVMDDSGAPIAKWEILQVPNDPRLPRAGSKPLDLTGWKFQFGVRIGIPENYSDDAIRTVAKNLGLNWETRGGQQVAIRNLSDIDDYHCHLSVVQADLRKAVMRGMGVGYTEKQILEHLCYHVTVETTENSDDKDNARYYSDGHSTTGWSKLPAGADYSEAVREARRIIGHK